MNDIDIQNKIRETLIGIEPELQTLFKGYFYRNPICEGWPLTKKMFPLPVPGNASILDVGCGSGGLLFYMWHLGYRNLGGSDAGIQKLNWAKKLHSSHGLTTKWFHGNLLSGIIGRFDVITAIGFLYENRDRLGLFFDQAGGHINKNGIVVFNWPVWEQNRRPNRPYFTDARVVEIAKRAGFIKKQTYWTECPSHKTALFIFEHRQ